MMACLVIGKILAERHGFPAHGLYLSNNAGGIPGFLDGAGVMDGQARARAGKT